MEDLEYALVQAQTSLAELARSVAQLSAEIKKSQDIMSKYDTVIDGDVQSLLDSKGEDAVINLPPGLYRLSKPLNPLKNQTIIGNNTEFKGSVVIGAWTKEGNFYVAAGQLPAQTFADQGVCEIVSGSDANACRVL